MASIYISTANAVVSAINAGTFDLSFLAERGYDVTADLEDMSGKLLVQVVPARVPHVRDTRDSIRYFPEIDVGVRYKFAPADDDSDGKILLDEIDAYIELLEQINEHLLTQAYRRLPDYRSAVLQKSDIRAPWIAKHLIVLRQYTGFIRLTYKIEKDLS